jgi:RHS repeat-associated protein
LVFGYIGGAWRHPLYDGLGSTRQLIKQSDQTVTDTYQYEAFGNLLASTGTTPNPYRYVGSLGYYQTGASLQHLGARYYMPESGRFAARDPLPGASVYAYVRNSPVAAVDASGLSPIVQGGKEIDCGQPECDPQRDRGALLTRMETVAAILAPGGADYLNELTHGGGISLATTKCFQNPDKISAITQCQAPYQGLASSVESCVRVHERVHRMQCLAHGASWFNDPANDWVAEKEAYYAEFQCLQGLLLRAGIWVF